MSWCRSWRLETFFAVLKGVALLDIVEIQSQTPNSIDLTKYTLKASSMRRFAFDWPFHLWRIFFEDWKIERAESTGG